MKKDKAGSNHRSELRKRAEALMESRGGQDTATALSPEEVQELLYELQTHQIQLEMQNEELRESEQELDASRARYFDLYDLAPVGYCTLSEKGLILEVNLAVSTLLNVPRSRLIKESISRFILLKDQDIYYHHSKQLFESGEPQVCELRMLRADSPAFWTRLEATTTQDEKGTPVCRIVLSDINERKRMEEAVRESHNAMLAIFDNVDESVYVADPATHEVLFSNRVLKAQLGSPGNRKCYEYLQSLDAPCSFCTNDKIFGDHSESSYIWEFENQVNKRWYRCIDKAIPWPDGRTVRYEMSVDITASKQAESQIRHLQKAEGLGRMAGAVAHHYNNLLGAVMGRIELAMEGLPVGSGPAKDLKEAMRAASRSAEMGDLLLAYLGQADIRRERLDLSEFCRKRLPDLRNRMPQDLTLEAVLPSSGPVARANSGQIRQILDTLIINAWEAQADRPGTVSLSARTVSMADVPAANRFPSKFRPTATGYACLEVADTGNGMAETEFEKIFDPFYSTKFTGRGLGLAVALGIVKAHHGCITVESALDRGSVLRVYLPMTTGEVPPPKSVPGPEGRAPQYVGTILLVEDEPLIRLATSILLKNLGMTVLEAVDGVEAVEVFNNHKNKIRCVLCDLTMPRMNGWDTLKALRQISPGIPVILASGYDQAHVMEGAHSELPQVFLKKPYKLADLKNVLAKAIALRDPPEELI